MTETGTALLGCVGFLYLLLCTAVGFCIVFPWGWTGVKVIILRRKEITEAVRREIQEYSESYHHD